MDMRISTQLPILIGMLVVMVSESSACTPLKSKFIFQGDQVDNNNIIIIPAVGRLYSDRLVAILH